jgi:hypothetical protein
MDSRSEHMSAHASVSMDSGSHYSRHRDSVTSLDELVKEGVELDDLFDDEQSDRLVHSRRPSFQLQPARDSPVPAPFTPSIAIHRRVNVFESDTQSRVQFSTDQVTDHDYRRSQSTNTLLQEHTDVPLSVRLSPRRSIVEATNSALRVLEKASARRRSEHTTSYMKG